MLDDHFKANPGVKDLSSLGIEPQSTSPQLVVIAMSYKDLFQIAICECLDINK